MRQEGSFSSVLLRCCSVVSIILLRVISWRSYGSTEFIAEEESKKRSEQQKMRQKDFSGMNHEKGGGGNALLLRKAIFGIIFNSLCNLNRKGSPT